MWSFFHPSHFSFFSYCWFRLTVDHHLSDPSVSFSIKNQKRVKSQMSTLPPPPEVHVHVGALRVALSTPKNDDALVWAQIGRARQRRLQWLMRKAKQRTRKRGRRQLNNNNNDDNNDDDNNNNGGDDDVSSSLLIADTTGIIMALENNNNNNNCHNVYTATIDIGEPSPQSFSVAVDTASSDLWVLSVAMTCHIEFANATTTTTTTTYSCPVLDSKQQQQRFNASKSMTLENVTDPNNNNKNNNELLYYNYTISKNEYFRGVFARDTIRLLGTHSTDANDDMAIHKNNNNNNNPAAAALTCPHQVFAIMDEYHSQQKQQQPPNKNTHDDDNNNDHGLTSLCQDGVLGLGHAKQTVAGFSSILGQLLPKWNQPLFGMYTTTTAAAVADDDNSENDKSSSSSSEIVFGAVDQRHYQNCLVWHDIGQSVEPNHENFQAYWDFRLDGGRIGDTILPATNLAILDSKSYFIVAPSQAVAVIAQANQLACFQMDATGIPDTVECDHEDGFDMVAMPCDGKLDPLEFYIGQETYTLDQKDLVLVKMTSIGEICLLRLLSAPDLDSWVLGAPFLNKYYTVFDFGGKRIGLAKSSPHHKELCADDWPLDIRYNGTALIPERDATMMPPKTPDIVTPAVKPESTPPVPFTPHINPPVPTPISPATTAPPSSPSLSPSGGGGGPYAALPSADTEYTRPSWHVFAVLLVVAWGILCVYRSRRRQERQRRLERYSLASRYDDGDIFAEHELELT